MTQKSSIVQNSRRTDHPEKAWDRRSHLFFNFCTATRHSASVIYSRCMAWFKRPIVPMVLRFISFAASLPSVSSKQAIHPVWRQSASTLISPASNVAPLGSFGSKLSLWPERRRADQEGEAEKQMGRAGFMMSKSWHPFDHTSFPGKCGFVIVAPFDGGSERGLQVLREVQCVEPCMIGINALDRNSNLGNKMVTAVSRVVTFANLCVGHRL